MDPIQRNSTQTTNPSEGDTQTTNSSDGDTQSTNPTEDFTQSRPLYRAAKKGDWKTVKRLICENPKMGTARINEDGATILHLAVCKNESMWVVEDILNSIDHPSLLVARDITGNTALSYAAIVGNIKAASQLVERNEGLLLEGDMSDYTPLHHAARVGHKEIVEFLLKTTRDYMAKSLLVGKSGATLFRLLIKSKLYGIALHILKQYMELLGKDHVFEEVFKEVFIEVLRTLAQKPQEFASGNHLAFLPGFIYQWMPVTNNNSTLPQTEEEDYPLLSIMVEDIDIPIESSTNYSTKFTNSGFGKVYLSIWNTMKQTVPCINHIHDKKLRHTQAHELVKLICKGMITLTSEQAHMILKEPLFMATKLGIVELVNEIIEAYPDIATFVNKDGQNIFQFAVLHRQEHIFKFIYKMDIWMPFLACDQDENGNNILHLAGKLQPSSWISGAALQMQRELQWFKAIENFVFHVRPSMLENLNKDQLTPRELFTKEHKRLVKEGQEWMKNAAQSYTVVAALIITMTFAAVFTVPGGNKTEGIPIYLHDPAFITFVVSDAIALLSSCISLLLCLGILTSRYSEEDFLKSLPMKLILGLITLYISLGCMMVAFSATLGILLTLTKALVLLPIITFVISIVFGFSQFSLMYKIWSITFYPPMVNTNVIVWV